MHVPGIPVMFELQVAGDVQVPQEFPQLLVPQLRVVEQAVVGVQLATQFPPLSLYPEEHIA